MGLAPRTSVELMDFPGLVTDVDPIDFEPGMAQDQVNAVSIVRGELQVRRGYRQVQFEND